MKMMIHRVYSMIGLLVLAFGLTSCAGEGRTPSSSTSDNHALPPMAEARSLNMQIMDTNLATLIHEAEAIEKQVDSLLSKLHELRGKINTHPHLADDHVPEDAKANPQPILPVETHKPAPRKVQTKPVQVGGVHKTAIGQEGVYAVRIGDHKDKIRLVFDINGPTKNKVDFDKEAGVITVTLPDTPWATEAARTYKLTQLGGYQAKNSNNGSIVAMSIKNTKSVKTETLGAADGKPARLIIDLMK